MFHSIIQEHRIKKALKLLARQRVAMVLQPGNTLVIELAPPNTKWFDIAVRTAHIRGWVEILHDSIPSGQLKFGLNDEPRLPNSIQAKTIYRLTEGGWAVIRRSHAWVIATFAISFLSLVAALIGIAVSATTANSEQLPGWLQFTVPKK